MTRIEWTPEQALAADDEYRRTHPDTPDAFPGSPVFQWAALHALEAERPAIDAGDGFALLGAIRICANHDLAMPDWLARQFIRRYDQVLTARADSWDGAFGRPYKKGAHLNALRKRRENRFAVYLRVREAHRSGASINTALFQAVAADFGINKTLAETLYYQAKQLIEPKE